METYVAVTGPFPSIESWEVDMRSIKFPYKYKKGKKKCLVRCGVCPMRIYKIVHPEDQLEALMNHIGVGIKGEYVTKSVPKLKKYLSLVRKLLGLKKCPLPTAPVAHMMPNQMTKAVAIVPIGSKKDVYNDAGVEQL